MRRELLNLAILTLALAVTGYVVVSCSTVPSGSPSAAVPGIMPTQADYTPQIVTTPRYFPRITCHRATGLLINVSIVRFSISSSITFDDA